MKKLILIALVGILTTGCASIKHTTEAKQPMGRQMMAGVGDVVLHVNKRKSLKNGVGGADIFGRTTDAGISELRFAGVERTGEVVFYRNDTNILTNETTMSRSNTSYTSGTATTDATASYYRRGSYGYADVNATTNYSSTTYSSPSDYHVAVPAQTIPIRLAYGEDMIFMDGYKVKIIKATPSYLKYKVTKY